MRRRFMHDHVKRFAEWFDFDSDRGATAIDMDLLLVNASRLQSR